VDNETQNMGFVQMTSDETLRATKRARNDAHRMVYELAKQALVEVNGQSVSEGDGSADKAWEEMSPVVQSLAVLAYNKLHVPDDADADAFLKSQQVSVG
jgi:hypothetical protein